MCYIPHVIMQTFTVQVSKGEKDIPTSCILAKCLYLFIVLGPISVRKFNESLRRGYLTSLIRFHILHLFMDKRKTQFGCSTSSR